MMDFIKQEPKIEFYGHCIYQKSNISVQRGI